jgi:hypothetical protein
MELASSVDSINHQLVALDDPQSRATLMYICEFLTLHWVDLIVSYPLTHSSNARELTRTNFMFPRIPVLHTALTWAQLHTQIQELSYM